MCPECTENTLKNICPIGPISQNIQDVLEKNLPCVRSPWLGQKDVMGVRSNNIAQIMVRKWISLPLCLYKTQRKYGENAQILVKWAFSSFWSRFWPMTHQRFFHHQFLSFFLPFLQKAKKFGTFVVTNVNIQIANYSVHSYTESIVAIQYLISLQ